MKAEVVSVACLKFSKKSLVYILTKYDKNGYMQSRSSLLDNHLIEPEVFKRVQSKTWGVIGRPTGSLERVCVY